jgi:hypothetical protein
MRLDVLRESLILVAGEFVLCFILRGATARTLKR